jgi:hypothetical protein
MKKCILPFLVLLVLIITANFVAAQTTNLIAAGSSWKYLANGTNQGTGWRSPTFSDASWLTGNAQFGYGDGDEATVISYGPNSSYKYITSYYRKAITITDPAAFTSYTILLKRDDGAAVYVNGSLVVLSNLPSTYGYTTRASSAINGSAETVFNSFVISSSVFTAGTNVIAVEIHGRSRTDADISFDLQLQATPVITCGTATSLSATAITSNSATIGWSAVSGAASYTVNYRISGSATWTVSSSATNSLALASLIAGTSYEFKVQANCSSSTGAFSTVSSFTTLAACNVPTGLTSSNINSTAATLSWNTVQGAASYNIQYRVSGSTSWILLTAGSNSINLSSLNPATVYEFNVRSDCGSAQSAYTSTQTFTTSPSAIPITDTLIQANGSWKYFDSGTLPSGAWTTLSYTETGWKTGNAELGYGDGDEATVVSFGPSSTTKFITTYFRKTFTTNNAAAYTTVNFKAVRDDGIVIYLNGSEVYRNNMPSGTITNATLASVAIAGTDESAWNSFILPASAVINGTNIIAVEIHQNAASSSDISFNALLTGFTGASVTRGPYLQMLHPNGITIRWRTNVATNSSVDFGTSLSYGNTANDAALTTEHIVTLTNLQPQTKYYYRIGSSSQIIQGDINNYFVTATPAGIISPLRIWATGDFGDGSTGQAAVRDAFATYTSSSPANVWLWLGDNAYNSGTDAEYQSYVFNIYPNQLKNIPLYPSLGNHDYANVGYQNASSLSTAFPYFSIFSVPQAAEAGGVASGTEKYYSYNNSNVHFIVLDSYGSYNSAGSAMYNWLQNDLASNTQRWTIVYFHHPPYTKGSHDSDNSVESVSIRQNINPLFDAYHVDLVLSGHSHDNERSYLIHNHYGLATTFTSSMKVSTATNTFTKTPPYEGTIYAVCGTSGRAPGSIQAGWPMPCMYFANSTNNCSMIIDVNGDMLEAKFLTSLGTIADQFTITKTNLRLPADGDHEFEIYSDPVDQSLIITFDLLKKETVEVKIFDATGRLCSKPSKATLMDIGRHEINIKEKMMTGLYFVRFTRGGKTFTQKILHP